MWGLCARARCFGRSDLEEIIAARPDFLCKETRLGWAIYLGARDLAVEGRLWSDFE